MSIYARIIKPIADFVTSLIGLLVFLPVGIIVSICILVIDKHHPFFWQPRPGKDGRIFRIFKFRTMKHSFIRRENQSVVDSITPLGKLLRKTSLDEIPQLLNVLKGDMSIIGPRPLRVEYIPHYSKLQARRHEVKPGITGWAQVNGRNTLTWEENFKHDVWYVDHMGMLLDLKILLLTIIKVFKSEGVNRNSKYTREPFKSIELND